MGNYEQLKQSVSDVIKTNGNQEITGSILQNVLLTIISSVGANATFAGVATPTTNPGTPDGPVFYLAFESGTYSNFNAIELQDELSVLMWNGSWSTQPIFSIDDVPTAGSDNLVKSGGVTKIYGKYINNPKFVRVYTDADGKIVWAIKTDGSIYYGAGVPQQVIDYIEEKIKNLSLDEYEDIVAFLNGLAEGDKTLQTLLNEKFDKVNVAQELGDSGEKVVSQFALPFKIVENSKYLYAIVDANNHFIAGSKKDGSIEWKEGIPTPIKAKLEQNKLDIDNKINLGSNIYPANIQSVTENKKYKEVLLDKDKKIIRGINKDNEEEIHLPQNLFGIKTTSLIENANYLDILYSRDGRMLSSRDKNGMLSEYAGVNAPFFLKNGKEIRTLSYEDTIYVAAKDSDDVDKASADYICDGINDEEEINEAIVALKKRSGTRYKKVILLSGHYYIDSFTEVLGDWKSAIAFHSDKGMLGDSLTISGISHYYRSTVIYVTEKALNSIADNTKYSVIMCMPSTKDNSVVRFDVQNIMIALANNQHPIVAINLQYGACGECKNIYMTASGLYDNSEVGINSGISARDNAVEGVVALRSYRGYTIGDTVRFDNICAFGFYTAFQLGCEHAIYNNLRSRFCHTGYTFGEYHTELVRGSFDHPMTLINCCDEHSIQGPVFAWNGLIDSDILEHYPNETDRKLQSVTFIDFNYEIPSRKAYEVEPGTFCGFILYHPSGGTFGGMPNYSFWKEGSGKNFTTINLTQANGGTSELRESYGAHYMQHFFDTDLNKETIFNGTNWVDCLGNIV